MTEQLYPFAEFSTDELLRMWRIDDAPAAPESYVKQHRSDDDCWCGPIQVGTLGVWTHRVVEP